MRLELRWTARWLVLSFWMGVLPGAGLASAETAVTVDPKDRERLEGAIESSLLLFVQNNYPESSRRALRSLQNSEGALYRSLTKTMELMQEYAQGPVTVRGDWQQLRGSRRFVVVGMLRGLQEYPDAVVFSTLYPGLFRPFTVVYVDRDGDGRIDEQSGKLTRSDRILDWFRERFPHGA